MFIGALVMIARTWTQPKRSSVGKQSIHPMAYYSAAKSWAVELPEVWGNLTWMLLKEEASLKKTMTYKCMYRTCWGTITVETVKRSVVVRGLERGGQGEMKMGSTGNFYGNTTSVHHTVVVDTWYYIFVDCTR
jgi:hypothetical protein